MVGSGVHPGMSGRCVLVIGAGGFVGRHLVAELRARHGERAVIGAGRVDADLPLDILDGAALRRVLSEVRPTHVVNLAGIAVPAEAAQAESAAWALHLHAVLDLGRAILEIRSEAWLLQVGSGLAYGRTARHGRPIHETEAMEPMDVYGASKAAGDIAIGAVAEAGLRVVRLRPFNHSGPGQTTEFVVPAFARQIAEIEAGLRPPVLDVGNLESARDFLDVRDVVKAYSTLILRSEDLDANSVLNVASGRPVVMRDILDRLLSMSTERIEVRHDPARHRVGDVRTICGDAAALKAATGWVPERDLDHMLHDVLQAQRAAVKEVQPRRIGLPDAG